MSDSASGGIVELARDLLNRFFGVDAHFRWVRIDGHEVWRVRHIETGRTVIVKAGVHTATARALADSGVAPRLLGVDGASGICVMEDLGESTLAESLEGADAGTASRGLLDLADSLGRLHAWASAPEPPLAGLPVVPQLPLAAFLNICGAIGVDAFHARGELIEAERCMRSEDPQVVLHGDVCPENYVPGASTRVKGKFVDFEAARRGNAMLDVACWHLPFPSCWRVARLPVELPPRMDATYRAQLGRRASAPDNATFERLMAAAGSWWLVCCLTGKRFIEAEDDRIAGAEMASVRERGLLWLDSAAGMIAREPEFKAAGDVALELAKQLRHRWAPVAGSPLFPAFMPRR